MTGRCVACNRRLNEYEMTRKDEYGQYLDMCNHCLSYIQEDVITSIPTEEDKEVTDVESTYLFDDETLLDYSGEHDDY